MADQINNEQSNFSEVVLGENEIICSLTNRVVKATDKELTLQSMINMMTEEYDFSTSDMERDFKVKYEDFDEASGFLKSLRMPSLKKDVLMMLLI